MNSNLLFPGESQSAVELPYFPTRWQAFLWRNWEFVPTKKLAEILDCIESVVLNAGTELGLPQNQRINSNWLRIGYLTVIRHNWHLLNYPQLLQLLDWPPEKLDRVLREEDFFWSKLGNGKPICEQLRYIPLTESQRQTTARIRHTLRREFPNENQMIAEEEAFSFMDHYPTIKPSVHPGAFQVNLIHPYTATCGDILLDIEEKDPIPEPLLKQYATMGVDGIWIHAILYLLHPVKGSEEFSTGWEKRLKNLARLSERCQRYGIGLYLYLNEPRGMPYRFYEKNPSWSGIDIPQKQIRANCTSRQEVLDWLTEALSAVFMTVPSLAGAILITMSENQTHCNSSFGKAKCPLCRNRDATELIAKIICSAEKGIHAGNPDAKLLAFDWEWQETLTQHDNLEFKKKIVEKLPERIWVMSVSEWGLSTHIGNIPVSVEDYSISQVGPSPESEGVWHFAHGRGMKTMAKIQMNNSWELSAVPYLPVPYLLHEHLNRLSAAGVDGLMLSWTLGGYPGGNLELLRKTPEEIAAEKFSPQVAEKVYRAWKIFSETFREFPFSCPVVYFAPMNFGPANPLYLKPTGKQATMIGFPYDDLATWRDVYPEEIFEEQFRKISEQWQTGLDCLNLSANYLEDSERMAFEDLRSIAQAAWCHFRSTYHQIHFVRCRQAGDVDGMQEIAQAEKNVARQMHELSRNDSRLGFEASNHYYYTLNSLAEKIINCEYIIDKLSGNFSAGATVHKERAAK